MAFIGRTTARFAVAAVIAVSGTAEAGAARPTQIKLKASASGTTVTLKGQVLDAAFSGPPASIDFQCGDLAGTVSGASLVLAKSTYSYSSPTGVVRKFTLSAKNGKFTISASGPSLGAFPDGFVPVTVDVGGERSTGLFPLGGTKPSRSWKKGQAFRVTLKGRVLRVRQELGSAVIAPAAGTTFVEPAIFVRNDASEQATVVGGLRWTDSNGNFTLVLELHDAAVLGRLDVERLLGRAQGLTVPSGVVASAARDGEMDVVTFVQSASGAGGTILPGSASTFDVAGSAGGTLSVPAGAVATQLPGVTFTPYASNVELPAPLPPGYVALAGAEVKAPPLVGAKGDPEPARFSDQRGPTVELGRPPWTDAQRLATAEIRLLEWNGASWAERPGRGRYDAQRQRIVPDPQDVPRLGTPHPVVYAAKVSVTELKWVRGRVKGKKSGAPIERAPVVGRNGGSVSGSRGAFGVPKSTLATDGLEIVQVVGENILTARVVQGGEADSGEVTVFVDEDAGFERILGTVSGAVLDANGTTPAPNSTLGVTLSGTVTALLHDDGGTPNFGDDTFSAPGLSELGTTDIEWAVLFPGAAEEFVSAKQTGPTARPFELVNEAQEAGRTVLAGAYTVRAGFSIPGVGGYALYAGFRVDFDGIAPVVKDIQLPAILEGFQTVTGVADASGSYTLSVFAPAGIPMRVDARSVDLARVGSAKFQFSPSATANVVLGSDAPHPPLPSGWSARANMPSPRYSYAVAAARGLVYVMGGYSAEPGGVVPGGAQSIVNAYNPQTDTWSVRASVPLALEGACAASVDGRIYVMGGIPAFSGGNATNAVYAYDAFNNRWSAKAPMPTARYQPSAAAVNGKIYVCGGQSFVDFAHASLTTVEAYDPATDTWSTKASLPVSRATTAHAPVIDGLLYLVSGTEEDNFTERVDVFDPVANAWSMRASMPARGYGFAIASVGKRLFVAGGTEAPSRAGLFVYDSDLDQWTGGQPMSVGRGDVTGISIGGAFYVPGGRRFPTDPDSGIVVPTVEVYVPE